MPAMDIAATFQVIRPRSRVAVSAANPTMNRHERITDLETPHFHPTQPR